MCGRAKFAPTAEIVSNYNIERVGKNARSDNYDVLTPGHTVPIVVIDAQEQRTLTAMHWGFGNPYNTRVETADTKDFWADSYESRRCIFPLSSFYEGNQWFSRGHVVSGAGIWRAQGSQLQCSLLTKPANEHVAPYHKRMPLVLDHEDVQAWLNATLDVTQEYVHAS